LTCSWVRAGAKCTIRPMSVMIPSAWKHASAFKIALARRKIGLADHHNKDPIVTQAIRHRVAFNLVQLLIICI
jgi:hypothetical protein